MTIDSEAKKPTFNPNPGDSSEEALARTEVLRRKFEETWDAGKTGVSGLGTRCIEDCRPQYRRGPVDARNAAASIPRSNSRLVVSFKTRLGNAKGALCYNPRNRQKALSWLQDLRYVRRGGRPKIDLVLGWNYNLGTC
jgi:hypothetical protein